MGGAAVPKRKRLCEGGRQGESGIGRFHLSSSNVHVSLPSSAYSWYKTVTHVCSHWAVSTQCNAGSRVTGHGPDENTEANPDARGQVTQVGQGMWGTLHRGDNRDSARHTPNPVCLSPSSSHEHHPSPTAGITRWVLVHESWVEWCPPFLHGGNENSFQFSPAQLLSFTHNKSWLRGRVLEPGRLALNSGSRTFSWL